jgi:sugar-specific transcriptional regulator TrmB
MTMDTPALKQRLRQFGLSAKEIDTYLAILEFGSATASDVADAAGVSKRYVYSASEELAERGFVTVDDHVVPTTIRANAPEEVVSRLQEELTAVGPALEERFTRAEPTTDQFEVLKSRATVLKRIRQQIDAAEEEVICAVPEQRFDEVADALADAVARGVLVVLVISDTASGLDVAGHATVARTWREPMPSIVTADFAAGLVAPTEMITRSAGDTQAIAFTQRQLGPVIVGSFFGNYWPNATEATVAPPDELPREYRSFRHAVLQATLHHRAGTSPNARLQGRFLDGDEAAAHIAGRVVETRQGLIEPVTNDFPVENALVIETADGVVSVGGPGAFVEDVELAAGTTVELRGNDSRTDRD